MAKAFFATFLMLAIIAGIIFFRTGIYKDVNISAGEQGPFILVYKEHVGPYHKMPPIIESIEQHLKEKGFECPLAFGRYLDNPDEVEHDRLRSHGGCAFSDLPTKLSQAIKEAGFMSEIVNKREYVVATFNGSPSMGPLVVYPKVQDWFQKYGYKQDGPVIEIYQTMPDKSVMTRYLFAYEI